MDTPIVDRNEYRKLVIEKVLPAIKSNNKWPGIRIERSKTIFLHQDNARHHILPNDLEFAQHATRLYSFKIEDSRCKVVSLIKVIGENNYKQPHTVKDS